MKKLLSAILNKKIILLIIPVVAFFAGAVLVKAQTTDTSSSAFGLAVSPPTISVTMKPGEARTEKIFIENVTKSQSTYYPEKLDFVAPKDESGTPTFVSGSETANTYSLSKWLTISTTAITLAPKERQPVDVTISVPANAEPSGHFGAVLFGNKPPATKGTGAAIAGKIGTLILVRIAGAAKENGVVASFTTDKSSYEKPPVNFTSRIRNLGNVHFAPTGEIVIKDIFGRSIDSLKVNDVAGNVLPDSVRKFENKWDKSVLPGYYKAELLLSYGSPQKSLTATLSFWILPWMQILIGLAILVVVILLLVLGIKRYNRYIVSKAENKQAPPTPPTV
jgi:hypothetical protein